MLKLDEKGHKFFIQYKYWLLTWLKQDDLKIILFQ